MEKSMEKNILEMRGISKSFPGVKALDNVCLKVKYGEVHAVCGVLRDDRGYYLATRELDNDLCVDCPWLNCSYFSF